MPRTGAWDWRLDPRVFNTATAPPRTANQRRPQRWESAARGAVPIALVIATPCAEDDPRFSAPLPLPTGVQASPLDTKMLGTWELLLNPGSWICRVAANGT